MTEEQPLKRALGGLGRRKAGGKGQCGGGQGGGKGKGKGERTPPPSRPGFFDAYPLFAEEGTVAATPSRLNFRHELIVEANAPLLKGARVLDIACNDGRFGLAALLGAGAAHVTGVEARGEAIERGRRAFAEYGVEPSRYAFQQGDVFEALEGMAPGGFDTAMVLGFLYHTARQYELFAQLDRLGVRNVIVDSQVIRPGKGRKKGGGGKAKPERRGALVEMRWEGTANDGAIADPRGRGRALSAIPSAEALEMWLQEFGWSVERTPLPPPAPNTGVYRRGQRVAMTGRR